MREEQAWYKLGIGFAVVCIVVAQLIWLFDPIRIGQRIFLIDMIDWLIYAVLLVPVLWVIGAVQGMRQRRRIMWWRSVIIVSTIAGGVLIALDLTYVVTAAICMCIALMLVTSLNFVEEWIAKRHFPIKKGLKVMLTLVLFFILLFPTSYMVTYPGLTMNMQRYAKAAGETTEHGVAHERRQVAGVLVFERPAFPIDWLYAQIFPHYEFRKIQPTDPSLGTQLNAVRVMKHSTNRISSALAMEKVGLGQGVTYYGAQVVGTVAGTAAAELLQLGDVIVAVNGQAITSASELIQQTGAVRPGDEIELIIERDGTEMTLDLTAGADPNDTNRAVIGVHIIDATELDVPLPVAFRRYTLHEGGPSHGAMLALTLIDQLTPGGVLNGYSVAGTGTIELDGTIGRIGGIRQKAYIVERAGADVFFVPFGQQDEAREGVKNLHIVPVETLEDILQWLEEHPVQSEV